MNQLDQYSSLGQARGESGLEDLMIWSTRRSSTENHEFQPLHCGRGSVMCDLDWIIFIPDPESVQTKHSVLKIWWFRSHSLEQLAGKRCRNKEQQSLLDLPFVRSSFSIETISTWVQRAHSLSQHAITWTNSFHFILPSHFSLSMMIISEISRFEWIFSSFESW